MNRKEHILRTGNHPKTFVDRSQQVRIMVLLGASVLTMVPVAAREVLHPAKIGTADLRSFATSELRTEGKKIPATRNRVMGASADRNFTSGLYSMKIKTSEYCEASPVDEFLFVIKGSQRFTSTDGTVVEVSEGEAAFIPKGWTGRWETEGFEEFYVVYDPDKTLQNERSKK
jgi:uncharacterized cupin superfamily protein